MFYISHRTSIQKEYYSKWNGPDFDGDIQDYIYELFPFNMVDCSKNVIQGGFHGKLIKWGVSQLLFLSKLAKRVLAIDAVSKHHNYKFGKNIINIHSALWDKDTLVQIIKKNTNQYVVKEVLKLDVKNHEEAVGSIDLINARSIDSLVDEYDIGEISFLNLTINGSESKAIKGAKHTIERNNNIIICIPLISAKNWLFKERMKCINRFLKMGYKVIVQDAPPLPWDKQKFIFACVTKGDFNINNMKVSNSEFIKYIS